MGGLLGANSNGSWHGVQFNLTHTNKDGSTGSFGIGRAEGKLFHDIFEAVRIYLPNGELVDLHDDYSNCKCFVTSDGLCGFAIEPDGNLVSVFSLSPSTNKGFLYAIKELDEAIRTGNWTDEALDELDNLNIEDYGRILKRFSQEELRKSNGILTQAAFILTRGNGSTNSENPQIYSSKRAREQEKQIED